MNSSQLLHGLCATFALASLTSLTSASEEPQRVTQTARYTAAKPGTRVAHTGAACDVCCPTSDSCGQQASRPGHCQCVKSLFHGPANMYPHVPYRAVPKTYYYFRPYNHRHIRQHQAEAAQWGATWGEPYSNALFKDVYAQFETPGSVKIPYMPEAE